MERIGHGWMVGAWDVYQEHQATQIVATADLGPDPAGPSRAGLGGPRPAGHRGGARGGPSTPCRSSWASWSSARSGWDVRNLGPEPAAPVAGHGRSATYRPKLVFLSASHHRGPRSGSSTTIPIFYEAASQAGTRDHPRRPGARPRPPIEAGLRQLRRADGPPGRIRPAAPPRDRGRGARPRPESIATDRIPRTGPARGNVRCDTTRRNRRRGRVLEPGQRRHPGAGARGRAPAPPGAGRLQAEARRGPGQDPRATRCPEGADDPQALAQHIASFYAGRRPVRGPARGDLPPLLRAPGQAGPGQHAAGRPRRQAVPRPRRLLLRPPPGGILRAPRGDRPVRPDPRDQAGHLRDLVDPPVDAAGRRRRGLPGPAQPQAPPPARPEPGRGRPRRPAEAARPADVAGASAPR